MCVCFALSECVIVFVIVIFFKSFFVSFLLLFFEFIDGVCGLKWMCCRGIVAYYVECTNVVKKWHGSDCVNRDYQGRRLGFQRRDMYT